MKDVSLDDNDTTRHVVIVVGMHRSGTSAIAQLHKNLGFAFGNNLIEKIDGINTDGFWEDKTVVAINEQILNLLGVSWYVAQSLPERWWERAELDACYQAAHQWHRTILGDKNPMAVKDPRFCRLLPFWLKVFSAEGTAVRIVFVCRHPASVAASLGRRDGLLKDFSYLLWLLYMTEAFEALTTERFAVVLYEQLVDMPETTAQTLLDGILMGIPNLKRIRFKRIANSSIASGKNHHPAPVSHEAPDSVLERVVWGLYKDLRELTDDNAGLIMEKYRRELNAILADPNELALLLRDEINTHIQTNKKLTLLGEAHDDALKTIYKKDQVYEKSLEEMQNKIWGNKAYIRKCQQHINKQDELLKTLGKKAEVTENLQRAVADREQKIAENVSYIHKCEARIKEQDEIILQLKKSTFIWPVWYGIKSIIKRMVFRF